MHNHVLSTFTSWLLYFADKLKKKLTKIVGFLKIAAELQLVVHKRLQKNNVL